MLLVCKIPVTSIPSPTIRFLVIATPPKVRILPLFKLVLAVVLVDISVPVSLILPITSKDSVGFSWFIPTRLSTSLIIVAGIPFLLVCRSRELPAAELYILLDDSVDNSLNVSSTPIERPLLFFIFIS